MLITLSYSEDGLEIILLRIFKIGMVSNRKTGYWSMLYIGFFKLSIGICLNYSESNKEIELRKENMHEA